MRAEVLTSRIEREVFFRTFIRGAKLSAELAKMLIDVMDEELYPAGSIIYQRGDRSEFIRYIVRGKVELVLDGLAPWTYGPRWAIGGLDAFQDQPHSRTAVAVQDTVCLKMRVEDYFDIMEDSFEFANTVLRAVCRSADEMSLALAADQVYPEVGAPSLLQALPSDQLGLVERMILLRSTRLFQRVRISPLVRIAQLADERRVEVGKELWPSGRSSDGIWIVARGRVTATRKAPPLSTSMGPGMAALALSVLGGTDEAYSVRATDPVFALLVTNNDLLDVMEDHPELVRGLLGFGASELLRFQTLLAEQSAG